MTGTKIDGNAIAKDIRERLKGEIQKLQETNPRFKPNLIIFQGLYSSRLDRAGRTDRKLV
jgi:5,10-methylene-tetrahydrofolate dehydrogenase/methenyl tetrahydrofolate cyclohydrolase